MTRDEIEITKRRTDQLVASYGALRLASSFAEAIEQLAAMWKLDPIDLQILRPGKSVAFSTFIKRGTSFVTGSGKSAAQGTMAQQALDIAKTPGELSAKIAKAGEKATSARSAVNMATKASVEKLKNNPKAALTVGVGSALASLFLGRKLKGELKTFNEACYKCKLLQNSN